MTSLVKNLIYSLTIIDETINNYDYLNSSNPCICDFFLDCFYIILIRLYDSSRLIIISLLFLLRSVSKNLKRISFYEAFIYFMSCDCFRKECHHVSVNFFCDKMTGPLFLIWFLPTRWPMLRVEEIFTFCIC